MDQKKIESNLFEAEVMRLGGAHIFGRREMQITVSNLCVNCFPKPEPAIFVWGGYSLCQQCFVPLRKELDRDKNIRIAGLISRDYAKTWGEEPITDAEVI